MACIVVTLHWPATSLNQAFPCNRNFMADLAQQVRREGHGEDNRARLRWKQIRMLHIEFARARR